MEVKTQPEAEAGGGRGGVGLSVDRGCLDLSFCPVPLVSLFFSFVWRSGGRRSGSPARIEQFGLGRDMVKGGEKTSQLCRQRRAAVAPSLCEVPGLGRPV